MGYELDFLAVGDKSQSGDAIALRWGELLGNGSQFIAVIDGGFGKNGEQLAELIKKHYGAPRTIDLVVSTHPDSDHVGGLSHILSEFQVKVLWLHQPWNYNIASKFKDQRATNRSIGERMKETCEPAWNLFEQAKEEGVEVQEPFALQNMDIHSHGGTLRILGPTQDYYKELLPEFYGMPETKAASRAEGTFAQMLQKAGNWVNDIWDQYSDSIDNSGETSARNNSSVILEFVYGEKRLLFTADAGIPALQNACGLTGKEDLDFIQIPHHGSRRNVGCDVLDDLVGEKLPRGNSRDIAAYVSCAAENPDHKHPSRRVLNAFTRRGCQCLATAGRSLRLHRGAPGRQNYSALDPLPFYNDVEDDQQ